MSLKAPKGKVLIENYEQSEFLRESGLVLPQNIFRDSGRLMMVRDVGEGVDTELKVGMQIVTRHHQGILVTHDGEQLRVCVPEDILLIVDG